MLEALHVDNDFHVEITREQYNALPPFANNAPIGTVMRWASVPFVVTKIDDVQMQFRIPSFMREDIDLYTETNVTDQHVGRKKNMR